MIKENLTENQKAVLNKLIVESKKKAQKKIDSLKEYIRRIILREAKEKETFSQYPGINVLREEVLQQIADDIQLSTRMLGSNPELVESFKQYLIMFVKDLINAELDISEIDSELKQIKGQLEKQKIQEVKVKLDLMNGDAIDPNLLTGEDEEDKKEDTQNLKQKEQEQNIEKIMDVPTSELDKAYRLEKRKQMEMESGNGQGFAKDQAIDLMNSIDDIILNSYKKVSKLDKLNQHLFLKYLIINILLHVDKAYGEISNEAPETQDVPGYEEEKNKMQKKLDADEGGLL